MQKIVSDFLEKQEVLGPDFLSYLEYKPVPKNASGDLALSFFLLAPKLSLSPVQIAQKIQKALENAPFVESMQIAGPYLNLTFKNDVFFREVLDSGKKEDAFLGKNIVLEFSGPNTNKPLHLGHMRNHALGISVGRILTQCGAGVHPVNIINDRGVHICKSMLAYKLFGDGQTPESTGKKSDHFVGEWYVRFEQEAKKDKTLLEEVQKMLLKWEQGDEETVKLWEKMSHWALEGHQKTYERQGVVFEKNYFESQLYEKGKEIAQEGFEKGVFKKREDGAIVIDLTAEGLDEKVVLRADGTSIYLTQDLSVARARYEDFQAPDEMIYVVADEQNYHFQVLFLCLEKLKILPRERLTHLGYGLVHLPHGRMKSREGTVVDADNMMDELSRAAQEKVLSRHPDLSEAESRLISEQIMNGAWKFYLLSASPRKTITFDPQASLSFEGATGPYLQYAGVRIKSILRKATMSYEKDVFDVFTDAEKPLGVKIAKYSSVLRQAAEMKNPTYIVTYLLELAQSWSSYYGEHSILGAENEDLKKARLQLAQKTLQTLEKGLSLLGIEIPEKM